MDAVAHMPGQGTFLEEKDVSVKELRRKPSVVWRYLEIPGHVIFFTRRKARVAALMSIETHACLSDDYEAEIAQVEEAARAYREEKKAARKRRSGHEQTDLWLCLSKDRTEFLARPDSESFYKLGTNSRINAHNL